MERSDDQIDQARVDFMCDLVDENKRLKADIRRLKFECEAQANAAKAWMKDYDVLKSKYEPEETTE